LEQGLEPGSYRVAVTSNQIVGEETAIWNAPSKYADFRTSGLEVVIDRPLRALKIELSWEGEEPESDRDAEAAGPARPESDAPTAASADTAAKHTRVEN
jgi:hypothetical protein